MSIMKRNIFVLLWMVFLMACGNDKNRLKTIELTKYEKLAFEENAPIIYLTLIHAYSAGATAESDSSIANLYICRKLGSSDSLFVFDASDMQESFVFDKENERQGFFINQSNVQPWEGKLINVKV